MASLKFASWIDGINTRVNAFRIKLSEAINAVDVNLSGFRLRPENGLDTTQPVPGDYNFKGNWITDETASKFTESGDIIIKSYEDQDPKFDRIYYDSDGNSQGLVGEKDLGSPVKPTSPLNVAISTATTSTGSGVIGQSSIFTETFGASQQNADTNTGLYSDLATDTSNATILKVYNNTLAALNKSTGVLTRRTITTGANSPSTNPNLLSNWSNITFNDVFLSGGYAIAVDADRKRVSICEAESGTTVRNYESPNPSGVQYHSASTYKHGYGTQTLESSSFTVNDGNLFLARNFKVDKYTDYQISTSASGTFQSTTGEDIRVIVGSGSNQNNYTPSGTSGNPLLLAILPDSVALTSLRLFNDGYSTSTFDVIDGTLMFNGARDNMGRGGGGGGQTNTDPHRILGCARAFTMNGTDYRAYLIYGSHYGGWYGNHWASGTDKSMTTARFEVKNQTVEKGYWLFGIHNGARTYAQLDTELNNGYINQTSQSSGTVHSNTTNVIRNNTKSALTHSNNVLTININSGATNVQINTTSMEVTTGASQVKAYARETTYPDFKPIYGTTTRINLSSLAQYGGTSGVTHSATNYSNVNPLCNGNIWTWRKQGSYFNGSGSAPNPAGWDKYQKIVLPNVHVENDEIKPLRDNFLATTEEWDFQYSQPTNGYEKGPITAECKTHLVPEGSSNLSALYTTNAYKEHISGQTTEDNSVYNQWFTFQNVGSASTTDVIWYGFKYAGLYKNTWKNVTASGNTQFGSSTGNTLVTLLNMNHTLIKQDNTPSNTHRYLFIDANTSTPSSNITVVDMNTMAVTSGTTTFGVTNAKDLWVDGNYRIVKEASNSLSVRNTSNNNESSMMYLPFGYWMTSSNNRKVHYGVSLDGANNDEINKMQKCFVFWMSEIDALSSAGIMNHDKSKSRNITKILKKANGRHMYILFADDNSFTYDQSAFFLNIETSSQDVERRPRAIATPTVTQFTGTIASANTITFPGDEVFTVMRKDKVVNVHGSNTDNKNVSSKVANTLTLDASLTGNPTSGSVVCSVFRYVHKNRVYVPSQYYGDFSIPSVMNKADWSATDYASNKFSKEQLIFDSISNLDFIPVSKSGQSEAEDASGNYYFWASMDKNVIDPSSNNDLGSNMTYVSAGVNLYVDGGSNIPFQYKYSFLRDISHSSESEFLIEGEPSNETSQLTLTTPGSGVTSTEYIRVESISDIPSDVTKVRIYRVGGEFSKYYWLVDLSVVSSGGSNSTEVFLDTNYEVGSDLITPFTDGGILPPKINNIVYVNGVYIGSIGSKLYFSRYADPHNWPELGFHEMEGNVTNIIPYYGEGLVFTDNAIYRVRGSNWDQMQVIKIPDRQGVTSGRKQSVIEYKGSVYFISNDGLCIYSGGQVNVISSTKFDPFPPIARPRSVMKDGALFIFEGSGSSQENGVKLDNRAGSASFSRISQKALTRAYYDQASDKIFLKGVGTTGSYLEGSEQSITYESGNYNAQDTESYKAFFGFKMTYSTTEAGAQIEFFSGDSGQSFYVKAIDHSATTNTLYCQFTNYAVAISIRYKLTGKINVYGMEINYEPLVSFPVQRRFEYADVQYKGTALKFNASVDNLSKTMTPDYSGNNLPSANETNNIRLYYPSDTVGTIPHYYGSGTGSIIGVNYKTSDL